MFLKKIKSHSFTFENYLTALSRVNVALIFLDERPFKGEDPQIIFETLNSLGKPLSLSDLVRNYVLLEMLSSEQSDVYEKIWYPKIEENFEDYTSKFFRDYLQYKLGTDLKVVSESNTKELYQIFKSFVENFKNKMDFVNDIVRFVSWYKWIISDNITDSISSDPLVNDKICELLKNIFSDIKTEPFKPFVLGLFEHHQHLKIINDNQLVETLETIRTYLIRRRVLKLSQGENKNIPSLSKRINEIADNRTTMLELLSTQHYNLRMPNDTELYNHFKDLNFYEELKSYSKFILGKIETSVAKVSVDFRDKKITIEHIMPQKLTQQWKNDLGQNYSSIHKKYLHNIGNIILTEFNNEIGNKPFKEKKDKYATSSLHYRLDVINTKIWNEDSILAHQKKMIERFLDTFPLPEKRKSINNWNQNTNQINIFSPLEGNFKDIVTGNKPKKMLIDSEEYIVGTWQDVFLKFISWIKNSDNYSITHIFDNQKRIFGKKSPLILKYSDLMSNSKKNHENYLKCFKDHNGRYASELDSNFNDYVYYTNESSETLIKRISSIMKEYDLDSDFIILEMN